MNLSGWPQSPAPRALHHGANRLPVQADVVGDGAPGQLARQARGRTAQGVRALQPLGGPRPAFDAQPTPRTPDAIRRLNQLDQALPERGLPPAAGRRARRGAPQRPAATPATVQPALLTASEMDDQFLGGLVLPKS